MASDLFEEFDSIKATFQESEFDKFIIIAEDIVKMSKNTELDLQKIEKLIIKNEKYFMFLSRFPLVVNMILSTKTFDKDIFKLCYDSTETDIAEKTIIYPVEFMKKYNSSIVDIPKFKKRLYDEIKKTQTDMTSLH